MKRHALLLSLFFACAAPPNATPKKSEPPTTTTKEMNMINPEEQAADRAFLQEIADTRSYALGRPGTLRLLPDGSKLLFLRSAATSPVMSLYSLDLISGEERELLNAEKLLKGSEETLSPEEHARRERMRVSAKGITSYELSPDGAQLITSVGGSVFSYSLSTGEVRELASKQEGSAPFDPRISPNGEQLAFVRGGELWVTNLSTLEAKQLTFGATEKKTHAQAEFVAQEEMSRFSGYWWSPDSSKLLYEEADASGVEMLYNGDPSKPEESSALIPYPRAGKKNVTTNFGVISIKGGDTTWLRWDQERYPYLARVLWSENAPLSILVSSRDQRTFSFMSVNEAGETKELHQEKDDAWLNLSNDYRWLSDGSGFLWPTEASGSWQLMLHDRDGKFVREVTPRSLGFRSVRFMNSERLIVTAGENPLEQRLYSIDLKGGAPVEITEGEGFFEGSFGKHGEYVISAQSLTGPAIATVYRADKTKLTRLKNVAKEPPFWPSVELSNVGEGDGFYTAIVRPKSFDPKKKYPVIVRVYGGPGARMVQASGGAYLLDQWIADHGFIVVKIDGRGTPDRGRAWERALYLKFSQVPLEDQVKALQALAKKEPALDLERVGVIGHSFGGYMAALSVMRRPDVYKAAVSSAPVIDWLDYDTFYTERYLGVPEEGAKIYEENSLLQYADKLSRPLLLIHGTADDNVHFNQSLKMADALFRAGKDFDFIPLAGQTHMIQGTTFQYWQKVFSFFRKNL